MKRLFHLIQRIEEIILGFAIIAIAALTIVNVFARAIFNFSLASTEELSQFLIILVTFVGLSYAASKGRHIRMTALYDQMGQRTRKVIMMFIAASTSCLAFFLAYHAIQYVLIVRTLGSVSPVLQVPLYLVYMITPAGLILAGIQYSLTVVQNFRQQEVFMSYDTKDEYEEPVAGEI